MVIRDELFLSGFDLETGYTVRGEDYDIRLDTTPDELVDEFLEEHSRDDREGLVEFVEDRVQHSYGLAREKGLSEEELEEQRIQAQENRPGEINMSGVWNGDWNGEIVGTCQERAITLHQMYDQLGHDAVYVTGEVELGDETQGHAWVETEDGYIADPSSVGGFYEKDYSDRTRNSLMVRGDF